MLAHDLRLPVQLPTASRRRRSTLSTSTRTRSYHLEKGSTPHDASAQNYVGDALSQHGQHHQRPHRRTSPTTRPTRCKLLGNVVGGKPRQVPEPADGRVQGTPSSRSCRTARWSGSAATWASSASGSSGVWDGRLLRHGDADRRWISTIDKADALDYGVRRDEPRHGAHRREPRRRRQAHPLEDREQLGRQERREGLLRLLGQLVRPVRLSRPLWRKNSSAACSRLLAQEPIELAPWDPMGTLAD